MSRVRALLRSPALLAFLCAAAAAAIWYYTHRLPPVPNRPLRIGFEHNPPVQIRTAGGYTGLAVETVQEAAKRAGIALRWVETGTSSDEAFQKGLVDLWPLMADLPDRRKRLHLTRPWLHSTHALVFPSANEAPGPGFASRIAYFRMPLHTRLLRRHFPASQPVGFPSGQDALRAVCTGNAQAAFLEGRAALSALRESPRECDPLSLRIHTISSATIQLGVASTFETAGAAEKLRAQINDMFRDGTLAVTMAKYSYYGLDDTWATYDLMEAAERERWLLWGIALLAAALLLTLWQSLSLWRARRAAEAAAAATCLALSRYQMVAHATNDALFDCDLRTGSVTWNDAVQFLFRYRPGQVGGTLSWWRERIHPDDRPRVLGELDAAIARNAPTWSGEYRFRRGDGSYASVVDRGSLVYQGGAPVRLVRAMMDVTPQRTLEEQLRQSQKMEAVGRLAGGIAHDFNNLLTVVVGHSELRLRLMEPSNPLYKTFHEILSAGRRAARLTQQLLAFSRRQRLQTEVLDLNALIAESAVVLRPILGQAVTLDLDLDPALGRVLADSGQIHQVLLNLAVNARDAMPSGGTLRISSANLELSLPHHPGTPGPPPGSYVTVTVADSGCGMSPEVQSHLFEPFFTTKEPGKGSGLGLSIVYGVVRQSGGFLTVSSLEGQGTSVRILLPRVEAPLTPPEPPPQLDPARLRGSESVLVVENESSVRELAASVLRGFGYRVLEAGSGEEALRLSAAADFPVQAVLTDIVMPRMTGSELADRLSSARPDLKVVFMSGDPGHDSVRDAMSRPGAVFLRKPFSPDALAAALSRALMRTPPVVLVAGGDQASRSLLDGILSGAGYTVIQAADAREIVAVLHARPVDLVLAGLPLPEPDGLDPIRLIEREFPGLPVAAWPLASAPETTGASGFAGAVAGIRIPSPLDHVLQVVRHALDRPASPPPGRTKAAGA